ncbi:MAG: hypothetical protein EOP53_05625 [Sphingobacteriales bacterium]|nr:MAG: hypothetical protein EOP53_05625 [Sphingobacteriales bacterium]
MPKPSAEFDAIDRRNDMVPADAFLDSAFCARYNMLRMSPKIVNRMVVYRNLNPQKETDAIRLCDIRWRFKNHQEALNFHRKYIKENSENGNEIKGYKFTIPGAEELRVFRESNEIADWVKSQNTPMNFYYYIFVVNNYAVKVFVNGKTGFSLENGAAFAKQAVKRTKAVLK